MADWTITFRDGSSITVPESSAATAEEAKAIALQRKGEGIPPAWPGAAPQPRYRTQEDVLRDEAQSVAGATLPPEIPYAGVLDRGMQGFLADNPPEVSAFYQQRYPGSQVYDLPQSGATLVQPQQGQPFVQNKPGMDWGDVAQFAGAAALPMASAFAGPWAPAAATLAEVAREGAQALYGSQRESLPEAGLRAGTAGALEGVAPAYRAAKQGIVGRALPKLDARLGEILRSPQLTRDLAEMAAARDVGLSVPEIMRWQSADSEIQRAIYRQVMQFAGPKQQQVYVDQLHKLSDSLRGFGSALSDLPADPVLQEAATRSFANRMAKALPEMDTNATGQAVIDALGDARSTRRGIMQTSWGLADDYLAEAGAKIDLSDVKGFVEPLSFPEESPSEIKRIWKDLKEMDAVTDFQTAKQLRTRVGKLYETFSPTELAKGGLDQKQVGEIYSGLTRAMKNPIGVSDDVVKRAGSLVDKANVDSVDYYKLFQFEGVEAIDAARKRYAPAKAWEQLSGDPAAWGPELDRVMQSAAPGQQKIIRDSLHRKLLENGDPLQAMDSLKGSKGQPNIYRYLFRTPQEEDAFRTAARNLMALRESVESDAFKAADELVGFADRKIDEITSKLPMGSKGNRPAGVSRALYEQFGGPHTPEGRAMRRAIWERITEPSLKVHPKTGEFALNPKEFASRFKKAEDSGLLAAMTDEDLVALRGLKAASKRMWKTTDSGTALTVAAQIGRMRHGDIGAASSTLFARTMSWVLTQPYADAGLLTSIVPAGQAVVSPRTQRALSLMIEPLRVSAEQSDTY